MNNKKRWPPVLAGFIIGLAMVATFYVAGRGLGTSGAVTRVAAVIQDLFFPEFTHASGYFGKYFAYGQNPLTDYLMFMMLGIVGGAMTGAFTGNDLRWEVLHGLQINDARRLWIALFGGAMTGFATRLARGCASGQALVGSAELSVGAWVFMLCIFLGGFSAAYFVRKQWL